MSKLKLYLLINLFISRSVFSFSDQIDGVLVPQGKFDSKLPVVTLRLDKISPPVVRITPSRPTVLIFPHQVSSCVSDNKALTIEKGNPMKNATENPGFSTVILKVDAAGLVSINSDIPEQTVINCQLVDANIYPIGVYFTDNNAYSVVKLLDNKQRQLAGNSSFDMQGFQAISLSDKKSKKQESKKNINNELNINIENYLQNKNTVIAKSSEKEAIKIKDFSTLLDKNGFTAIKKENLDAAKK